MQKPQRVNYGAKPDLLSHFKSLTSRNELPSLDTLIQQAGSLIDRYASQDAYDQALSKAKSSNAPEPMKILFGPAWTNQSTGSTNSAPVPLLPNEDVPKVHKEADDFDGDHVLANSVLFLQDFGWWIEIAYAVSEGDIGRVFEILKIWIFTFAGSSHHNYMTYLLEVYCLLRYEASRDLRDVILNNWLVNVTGELGKWIEGDLLQEHYNRWLEDMVKKRDENLHLFCAGRTLGHVAVNQFNQGYDRLQQKKLNDFINKTTAYADIIADIQSSKQAQETAVPSSNLEVQDHSQPSNDDSLSDVESVSDSSKSDSASSSTPSSSTETENEDTEDPSNNHLVSSSDYDVYLSSDQLTHKAWYEQEGKDNSSDEEDDGLGNGFCSDGSDNINDTGNGAYDSE
ncbi:uncharacterized protein LACBIDRAFT_333858 [Laccaria bicolor S238N-H82]|uniref:Predicted protein n=1 Tax=Laccaria bicolor (strain S238N-H82 / ATCC MYA-4686) TaxID=486041 RepID=B0DXB0_LACBS|nr:uncharacterized protein LACBIDRAFT_333858 [Laccaria bicolor S238N-H82]EDR00803.1 predicted protein [Laccaria bicolor S238N-H82]|eukprot:XP_001888595.1 predicted protein [Laccaria bicolor S238N-H82]